MMNFLQSMCHRIEQFVVALEGPHWAALAVILVVAGYLFLRRGHI